MALTETATGSELRYMSRYLPTNHNGPARCCALTSHSMTAQGSAPRASLSITRESSVQGGLARAVCGWASSGTATVCLTQPKQRGGLGLCRKGTWESGDYCTKSRVHRHARRVPTSTELQARFRAAKYPLLMPGQHLAKRIRRVGSTRSKRSRTPQLRRLLLALRDGLRVQEGEVQGQGSFAAPLGWAPLSP